MCDECMPMHSLWKTGRCGCRFRQFLSSEEEVESLEGYRNELQREIAGVERRIEELNRKSRILITS